MKYASGKFAHGFCERCGFRYDYKEFKKEKDTGLYVCGTCFDHPHPQDHPEKYMPKYADPEALRHPLPEDTTDDEIADGDAAAYIASVNSRP